MKQEFVLWAVKIGDPDGKEQIITTSIEHKEAAKKWAKENGFDRFRELRFNLNEAPDFTKIFKK